MKIDVEALKVELAAVLKKYNVSIEFEFADGADTHGLYDSRMVIKSLEDDAIVFDTGCEWGISAHDLK